MSAPLKVIGVELRVGYGPSVTEAKLVPLEVTFPEALGARNNNESAQLSVTVHTSRGDATVNVTLPGQDREWGDYSPQKYYSPQELEEAKTELARRVVAAT